MVGRIFKSKKSIISILVVLVIIISCLGAFVVLSKDTRQTDSTPTTTESKNESSKTSRTPDKAVQLTAPEAKLPETCAKINETVKQTIGEGSKITGNSASTNNNSKITECNYSKDSQLVNVKVYEYKTESDAKADLSKVQVKGYAGQNKGKYNVVVSVTNTSGPNLATAEKIVKLAVEKL